MSASQTWSFPISFVCYSHCHESYTLPNAMSFLYFSPILQKKRKGWQTFCKKRRIQRILWLLNRFSDTNNDRSQGGHSKDLFSLLFILRDNWQWLWLMKRRKPITYFPFFPFFSLYRIALFLKFQLCYWCDCKRAVWNLFKFILAFQL